MLAPPLSISLCLDVGVQMCFKETLGADVALGSTTNLNNTHPAKGMKAKRPKIGFQEQLSLNTGQKYCRML